MLVDLYLIFLNWWLSFYRGYHWRLFRFEIGFNAFSFWRTTSLL